jgi:hypothetical protein
MYETLSISLGQRDILWSFFLASNTLTPIKLSNVGFSHMNDVQPFLPIGMEVVVLATRYSQPKEKVLRRALDRDQIINDPESQSATVTQVTLYEAESGSFPL